MDACEGTQPNENHIRWTTDEYETDLILPKIFPGSCNQKIQNVFFTRSQSVVERFKKREFVSMQKNSMCSSVNTRFVSKDY